MKRRRLLFATLVIAPTAAIAVACTFPDVEFGAGPDGGLPDGIAADNQVGANDSGGSETSTGDQDTGVPVAYPDGGGTGTVIDRSDAQAIVDAASCDGKCDCDLDGYLKKGCTTITALDDPDSGRIAEGDCIDNDPLVHPGIINFVRTVPTPPNEGDWNCDGVIDHSVPAATCNGLNNGLSPCSGTGEKDDAGCGNPIDFYTCEGAGLATCALSVTDQRLQTCK